VAAVVAGAATVWGAVPAGADPSDPTKGVSPSSAGMPGGALVEQIIGWGMWLGLAACAAVIIYGAATWHGWGGASAGRSLAGKTFVLAGAAGLVIIGLVQTIVSTLY